MMKFALPVMVKIQNYPITRKAQKGQGVIEYAGALVVASCLLSRL